MTPYRLKSRLKKAGVSQFEIARRLGVTRQAVNHVVCGRRAAPRIREAIARALGLQVSDIWPDTQGCIEPSRKRGHVNQKKKQQPPALPVLNELRVRRSHEGTGELY